MSVSEIGIRQFRHSISEWRVFVPADVDRETYIRTCFLTGTVSLGNFHGEIIHRVSVGQLAIQTIKFPTDSKSFGSRVVCLTSPRSGKLYVADVFSSSSEFNDQDEDQYRLFKTSTGYAEVRIDGKGKISLGVDGEEDGGEVSINVTNKNKQGKLKLNVNGDITITNQGNIEVTSDGNIKATVSKDGIESSVEVNRDEIKLTTPDTGRIYLNESEEPVLLGKKVTEFLSDLLDQLGKESAGPYPLLGNSSYLSMKNKLDALKSTISFVK